MWVKIGLWISAGLLLPLGGMFPILGTCGGGGDKLHLHIISPSIGSICLEDLMVLFSGLMPLRFLNNF